MMGDSDTTEFFDSNFYRGANWRLAFALFPHRCKISNKLIWLKFGYEGRRVYYGPDLPVYETKWHDACEHIIWELKRNR